MVKELSQREDILGFLWLDDTSQQAEEFFRWPRNGSHSTRARPVSYIVISRSGEILEKSIRENIDFEILTKLEKTGFQYDDGVFLRKGDIEFFLEDAVVFFYKKNPYPASSFGSDVIVFTIFTFLFSIIFYVLSYKFVGKTLKPVEENLTDMKDFIHNAGHELKTPLAVLRGNLQIIQAEKKLDPKLLKQWVKEVDRLAWLIDSLVELSDTGKNSSKETFPLMIEIARIVNEFQDFSKRYDVTVKNSVTGKYTLFANKEDLYVVVANILKNAIKYNKKSGEVFISFKNGALTLRDTWVGISEKNRDKIFERFFQAETARGRNGFGIGLSLAKKVADANGWKIEVESEEGKGTSFTITF